MHTDYLTVQCKVNTGHGAGKAHTKPCHKRLAMKRTPGATYTYTCNGGDSTGGRGSQQRHAWPHHGQKLYLAKKKSNTQRRCQQLHTVAAAEDEGGGRPHMSSALIATLAATSSAVSLGAVSSAPTPIYLAPGDIMPAIIVHLSRPKVSPDVSRPVWLCF